MDEFRKNATDIDALQLVTVTEEQERSLRRQGPDERVHERQIHHAGLIDEHDADFQRSQGVAPVGTAAFGRFGPPLQGSVQRDGGDAAEECSIALSEPCQAGCRLCDGFADATGRTSCRSSDQDLVRGEAGIDAVPDGQECGGCGGLPRAGTAGQDTHGGIHQRGDGQTLLGIVEVDLVWPRTGSTHALRREDFLQVTSHLDVRQSRRIR